jgi:molybdenum cofactor biosynthesis protein MoaF
MKDVERAAPIRGKTIRFAWTEGPTKGKTHEHVFHQDGTVTWSDADTTKAAQTSGSAPAGSAKEQPQYAATRVTDQIYAVSYLSSSGYTLTVILNFGDQQLAGFVSSSKDWYPLRGTFQVVK